MLSTPRPPEPKPIMPGLLVEWTDDGQIVIFVVRDLSRPVIDAWVTELQAALDANPAGQPFLSLYDLNFPRVTLTPYAKARIGKVLEDHQNLSGRTALVMPRNFLVALAQIFLRGGKPGTRQRRIFHSREDGLAWLRESLSADGK